MSYGRAEAGVKCDQSVVVAAWAVFGGDANGGLGGGTDVGGGGDGREGHGIV